MRQTETYWSIINRVGLGVLILVAIIGISLAFIPKVNQLNTYQQRSEELQREIDKTTAAEQQLKENQRRFATDPDFVERIAHEVGYAHPEETIFHFPENLEKDER
jgi:cell division protein FtsB|tara:strand:- start:166 stop:480 length:315 start_codon:yes stop_codon:yes gene_type:complete